MKKLPKSARKFIRTEKARMRREILVFGDQQKQINKLFFKFSGDSEEKESLENKNTKKEKQKEKK